MKTLRQNQLNVPFGIKTMSDQAAKQLFNRRQVIANSLAAAGTAGLITTLAQNVAAELPQPTTQLKKGDTILFQGDSITDAGRSRNAEGSANNMRALGHGYPLMIGADLMLDNPSLALRIFNRGISGHKVPDLQKRWDKDCIQVKPNLLSILVGVNDIWHKLNGKYDGTVESYLQGFKSLLAETKQKLPGTTIIVCEPFALKTGAVNDKWFPEFEQRRAAAREASDSIGAVWVPFQKMFDDAVAAGVAPEFWAADGVHPSIAGNALMAATWRKVVGV
jgi:lysophospholipase L1-like esterase